MSEEVTVYRKLQKHLDQMPVGFPATESGVEIRVLKHFFTSEEADIALNLSALPEPVNRIHSRAKHLGLSIAELERALDRLVAKGAILGRTAKEARDGEKRYSKAMLAIGMYEFQVDRITEQLQRDLDQYFKEGFADAFHSKKTSQMRTIPINETVIPDRQVDTYDHAKEIVQNSKGPFAVMNCVCRQGKDKLGEPCQQTEVRRTCITLKGTARSLTDSGVASALSRAETLELLDRAEEIGMILQPENTQDPNFICCCCGCCCGVLTSAKIFPRPAEYLHSNFSARVDPELCTACETCSARCQMDALSLVDEVTRVDLDRCIGCGLCVTTCPTEAIQLEKKPKPTAPPKDRSSLYRQITVERFGVLGAAKMVGKSLLGTKI